MNTLVTARCREFRVLVAIAAVSLAGCMTPQKTPRRTIPSRDVHRLASEYLDSLDTRALRGNIDSFLAKWSDEFEHTMALATMRNKEELREFLIRWSEMFTRWRHIETRRLVHGNVVAWEGVATGVHRTTGKSLELPMVIMLEFDQHGKVKMSHVYFDSAVLQQQLQAESE